MPAPTRKACANCVKSKRKCDLAVPICGRCVQRNVSCDYSEADRAVNRSSTSVPSRASHSFNDGSAAQPSSNDEMDTSPDQSSLSNSVTAPSSSVETPPHPNDYYSSDLDHMNVIGPAYGLVIDEDFIVGGHYCAARVDFAQTMLKGLPSKFVERGQCAFVNPRLYEEHDAPTLDVAFSACAAYCSRNERTDRMVKRTIRRNVQNLKDMRREHSDRPILQLADTQAMLLYQLVRLFDGDVRLRAEAEADRTMFMEWADEMRTHMTPLRDPWGEEIPRQGPCAHANATIERMNEWYGWIFEESMRRTLVVAYMLDGTFESLKFGFHRMWGKTRKLGFCAQRHLWEAESAFTWWKITGEGKRPLRVILRDWDEDMEQAKPDDIEELGLLMMVSLKGQDSVCNWLGPEHMKRLRFDPSTTLSADWGS